MICKYAQHMATNQTFLIDPVKVRYATCEDTFTGGSAEEDYLQEKLKFFCQIDDSVWGAENSDEYIIPTWVFIAIFIAITLVIILVSSLIVCCIKNKFQNDQ